MNQKIVLRPSWNAYVDRLSIAAGSLFLALYSRFVLTLEGVATLIPFALAGFAVFMVLSIVVTRYSYRYAIEDGRLSANTGLISKNETQIRLQDIRGVNVTQSITDRMLNTGNLSFSSSAQNEAEVVFLGIDSPMVVRKQIQALVDEAKTEPRT